jgi:HEAT repeat protein
MRRGCQSNLPAGRIACDRFAEDVWDHCLLKSDHLNRTRRPPALFSTEKVIHDVKATRAADLSRLAKPTDCKGDTLMLKLIIVVSSVLLFVATCNALNHAQQKMEIDGKDLASKVEAALHRGHAQSSRYWIAYAFDVAPGVAIDADIPNPNGSRSHFYGMVTSAEPRFQTRNLGVFMLHDPQDVNAEAVVQVELYNLDRKRDYQNYPVYWLGHVPAQESMDFLKKLIESSSSSQVYKSATIALAVHEDPAVGPLLEDLIRNSGNPDVSTTALFWLSKIPGEKNFLATLVADEQASLAVRKEAASALGMSQEAGAYVTLASLYETVQSRELKDHIIFAATMNSNLDDSVNFLIKVAGSDSSPAASKQAQFGLSQKMQQLSAAALGEIVERADVETEIQKQALAAVGNKPADQSVPILVKIARTHPKAELRQQAISQLAASRDARARNAYKELSEK